MKGHHYWILNSTTLIDVALSRSWKRDRDNGAPIQAIRKQEEQVMTDKRKLEKAVKAFNKAISAFKKAGIYKNFDRTLDDIECSIFYQLELFDELNSED